MEEINAKNNPAFHYCAEMQGGYIAMTTFVVYRV